MSDYNLKLEACDLIEELLTIFRLKSLSQAERSRIEDFAVNYLGED